MLGVPKTSGPLVRAVFVGILATVGCTAILSLLSGNLQLSGAAGFVGTLVGMSEYRRASKGQPIFTDASVLWVSMAAIGFYAVALLLGGMPAGWEDRAWVLVASAFPVTGISFVLWKKRHLRPGAWTS